MTNAVDLVVRGGTVVNESWSRLADVVVRDGRIVAITDPDEARCSFRAEREIDATGRLVLPGGVDPHCHVGFTSGEFTTLDDYRAATRAAVYGGTTTIVDFAIPRPGESPLAAAEAQRAKASTGFCDSALHACVTAWTEQTTAELDQLVSQGIVSVKMFTTYRGETMASADTIVKVMDRLRDLGGIAYIHAEANHLIEYAQDACVHQAEISAPHHHHTRPIRAELAAVADVLAIAESLRAPVYFVHLSTAAALNLVQESKKRGFAAYSEVVAHHVVLDDTAYSSEHPERYVCCPPLRSAQEVTALRSSVIAGNADTLASDHCCYSAEQKVSTKDDVRMMPNGLPGVETRLPLLFTELVSRHGMPLEKFVALTATNPARLNGLYPRKGAILPGSDADLAIWSVEASATLSSDSLHMATDYTPYEGRTITASPQTVVVRGRVVLDEGRLADAAYGRHVPGRPVGFGGLNSESAGPPRG
jgi:dihydropyrimidinase